MNQKKLANLKRLLSPSHIAVFGGRDAEVVIGECRRIGYAGEIWPVNPKRDSIAGIQCVPSVQDLPQTPDASFVAVPSTAALQVVRELNQAGAGGVVCYTAGFGDTGREGGESDKELVIAAGDLALIGPNCYGMINYLDKVALWPFEHGGFCPGYGAAIITQSGMLSSDITMNQRSLPLATMISAGNQSVLQIEHYIDVLCERDEVKAIGLHIEGLKDIDAFSRVAIKCLELDKPIVVLKSGSSRKGSELALSHTGSMSGSDELYQALFRKLNIISVDSPAKLIETLKFLCISGAPEGKQMIAFTCSGGGASLVADYAEKVGISLEDPAEETTLKLEALLPSIATVSNPLDYTTPIWGQPEKTRPVFEAALSEPCDVALLVQDYPLPGIDDSKQYYLNDAGAFAGVCSSRPMPAVVCSTLPENIDQITREYLIKNKVSPLQGIHEALDAIKSGMEYEFHRHKTLSRIQQAQYGVLDISTDKQSFQLDEASAKAKLHTSGIAVPAGKKTTLDTIVEDSELLGYPIAIKLNSSHIAHKTDLGAVALGIENKDQVLKAATKMIKNVNTKMPAVNINTFLIEKMMPAPVAELVVGVRADTDFGLVLTLGSGGTLVELVGDSVNLILPVSNLEIEEGLSQLKVYALLEGYRGKKPVNTSLLIDGLQQIIQYILNNRDAVANLEINPLFVYDESVVAIDVLMHHYQ